MNSEHEPELRNSLRFPLHLPVTLRTPLREYTAETLDISAGGILFRSESSIQVGSTVEFTIRMPGEVLGAEQDVLVKCSGRIVRSDQQPSGQSVAVAIDEYQFERL